MQEEHSKLSEEIKIATGRRIMLEDNNQELLNQNKDLQSIKEKLLEQNEDLEKQNEAYQEKFENIANRAAAMERDVRKYEEDPEWRLPEAGSFASAKTYRENYALPLWRRLVAQIKKLALENIGLLGVIGRLKEKISSMESEIYWLKDDAKIQNHHTEQLEEQVVDYNRVKKYMGEDRVQQIVDNVKLVEEREREHRKWNRSMEWSR